MNKTHLDYMLMVARARASKNIVDADVYSSIAELLDIIQVQEEELERWKIKVFICFVFIMLVLGILVSKNFI